MKMVKIAEYEKDGIVFDEYIYKFTAEEKKLILAEFESWQPDYLALSYGEITETELLNNFIYLIELNASFFLDWINGKNTMKNHIEDVRTTLQDLKTAQRHLKRIADNKLFVPRLTNVAEITGAPVIAEIIVAVQLCIKSHDVLKPLEFLIQIMNHQVERLGKLSQPTGRTSADLNSGLVLKIGELLRDFLEIEPTTYAAEQLDSKGNRSTGGIFYRLTKTILEILGLPSEDPRRLVKNAVKILSENHPKA